MLTSLAHWLRRIASSKLVVADGALFVLFVMLVLPRQADMAAQATSSTISPDTSLVYSGTTCTAWSRRIASGATSLYSGAADL